MKYLIIMSWIFFGRTDAEAEAPILWQPDAKNWLTGKGPDAGKDWRQEETDMTEDEMAGWHYWLDAHEFEQALGVGDGQGTLACCSSWGHKELDMTEQLTEQLTHLNWSGHHGLNKLSHKSNHYKYICIFVVIQRNNQCIHWLPQKGENKHKILWYVLILFIHFLTVKSILHFTQDAL